VHEPYFCSQGLDDILKGHEFRTTHLLLGTQCTRLVMVVVVVIAHRIGMCVARDQVWVRVVHDLDTLRLLDVPGLLLRH